MLAIPTASRLKRQQAASECQQSGPAVLFEGDLVVQDVEHPVGVDEADWHVAGRCGGRTRVALAPISLVAPIVPVRRLAGGWWWWILKMVNSR